LTKVYFFDLLLVTIGRQMLPCIWLFFCK